MTFDWDTGNVGIGTDVPSHKLSVGMANTAIPSWFSAIFSDVIGVGHVTDSTVTYLFNQGGSGIHGINAYDFGANQYIPLYVGWGGNNVYIAKDGGNVGIGTTSPAYRLHVEGNVGAYAFINISDQRWKTNIKPIQNALDNVLKMQGVTYYWKVDEYPDKHFPEGEQVGFIAQEIEKVYPQVVLTDKDGYKSVDYSKLTPVLVEAIKEQQQIIEQQTELIEQQQQKLQQQEQLIAGQQKIIAEQQAKLAMLEQKYSELEAKLNKLG